MIGDMGALVSKNLDWLVISEGRAVMQGTATIKGKGTYKFVATVMDAGDPAPGYHTGDAMRLQVWDMSAYGKLVFDNNPGGDPKLDLMQPLPIIDEGKIVINGGKGAMAAKNSSKLTGTAADATVTAYPNPFSAKAKVSFSSMGEGTYQVLLYDAKGALVSSLKTGTATGSETIAVEVNGAGLKDGLYFVKMTSGSATQSIKLLLQR